MNVIETRTDASCASRVYYEGLVPPGSDYPFATVQEVSFAPAISHAGNREPVEHIIGINVIAKSLGQLKTAMEDADRIFEKLHGRKFSVQLADLTSVECRCVCQGGTTFKDADTKEIVVQRTYQITHQ